MEADLKKEMERYFDLLWPINRSITGPGFRKSLEILSEIIPTERLRFESGSKAFDWVVPKEWKVNEAYIVDPSGKKITDFSKNNLHLMGYSIPIDKIVELEELKPHLHTLEDKPDAIPFATSYFKEDWGFCLTHNEYKQLSDGAYHVVIDSELYDGCLEIGEAVIPGEKKDEVLFSSYLCHPSMANNELSGPIVLSFLYNYIKNMPKRQLTYRFVLSAETIGTICYLSLRGDHLKKNLKAGYVLTCLGDSQKVTYKYSRNGNTLADRVAKTVLKKYDHSIIPFVPFGSDERQYCSPGFNLPVGSIMRTRFGQFHEYHTSLDNKEFLSFDALASSLDVLKEIVNTLENNRIWRSTVQFGEPQLSRHNLYPKECVNKMIKGEFKTMKWLLNLADGSNDLIEIANRSQHKLSTLALVAERLALAGLLEDINN